MAKQIILRAGTSECTVCPALGGGIAGWSVDGQAMLRRTSAEAIDTGHVLGLSSFPLVPYSNRIAHGQFEWAGHIVRITPNFAPEPHAIHGTGWEDAWQGEQISACQMRLHLTHSGDARWPWPFDAEQIVTVCEDGLSLALSATNLADVAVPLAFGHHPYFDSAGASMTFAAERVWMTGDDGLPSHPIAPSGQFDFAAGGQVEGCNIDHCYADITWPAKMSWERRPLRLEIGSNLPAAVVYVPKGGASFCFEPVPHINNALNLPDHAPAMPIIAPGERFEATIVFKAIRA